MIFGRQNDVVGNITKTKEAVTITSSANDHNKEKRERDKPEKFARRIGERREPRRRTSFLANEPDAFGIR